MSHKKVLIIRFSSIGDVVLTTPIVRCIKKQWNAEVHYLIKPSFAHVIHENPYIDKVIKLKESLGDTVDELKEEKYDLVIDLQKNLKSFRIKNSLSTATIAFEKLNIKKWMAVNLKINKLPNDKHLVDRYFESLLELGLKDDGEGLDYFIMPEDEYDAQGLIQGIHYQVLVLGATYFTKRISLGKSEEIVQKYEHHTVLIGGKDVYEEAQILAEKYPSKVINYCGKIGLGVSAGMVKHAEKVVTGDTGMMHIAAALQKHIVVLWGNTIPEFGMYPYYGYKNNNKHTNLEVKNLSCRPCSKLGYDACPKGHFRCMTEIIVP